MPTAVNISDQIFSARTLRVSAVRRRPVVHVLTVVVLLGTVKGPLCPVDAVDASITTKISSNLQQF